MDIKEKANDYFKRIDSIEKWVVDYEKLDASPFPICVVISERMTRVKTYGAKEYTYKQWLKTDMSKPNTLWLRNLADDINIETLNFGLDVPKIMEGVAGISNKSGSMICKDNKPYAMLSAINSPRSKRGSRVKLKYIVWDEFNDSVRFTGKMMVKNFLNLLSSTQGINKPREFNERKAFVLGNNRTMNHPLFIELGIGSIKEEVTKIYDVNDNPLMLIICPKLSEDEINKIEEDNKNDWVFQLAKMTNEADHIYFNKSEWDDANSVYPQFNPKQLKQEFAKGSNLSPFLFKVDGHRLAVFTLPTYMRAQGMNYTNKYHVVSLTLLENEYKKMNLKFPRLWNGKYFVSHTKQQTEGDYIISNDILNKLALGLAKGLYSFENAVSRDYFFKFLNKA